MLTQFASLASIALDNAYLWQGIQRELEERRRSEQQALRYREIIERTPDMVFILDAGGKIIDANRAVQDTYGYTLEELKSLPIGNLRAPECRESLRHLLEDTVLSNQRVETLHICRDGRTFPVEVALSRINLETETGFVSIARDISAQKNAEEALRANYDQLAETMEQLKRTQGQLLHQEKLASIGQLAAGVAHEINNPLAFVNANIESMRKYAEHFIEMIEAYREFCRSANSLSNDELQAKQQRLANLESEKKLEFLLSDYGDIIKDSKDGIERIVNIIRGLSAFSRIDAHSEFKGYNLNEGIQSTLVVARNEVKYNADVELELDPIPEICASGGQINQVLLNILVNASHAIKSKAARGPNGPHPH